MSKHYALQASKRERAGKGVARALRRENNIPGVIYGGDQPPVTISLDSNKVFLEYLKGHMYTNICDLDLEGKPQLVLARDVQLHPVTDRVIHIDFLRVTDKTKIRVEVPVHFINHDKSPGLKEKAVLNIVRHEVELMCSATDIPESIDVDLTGMEIGDAVKISHAKLPEGTSSAIKDRDFTIATLQAPKAFVEMEIVAPASDAEVAGAAASAAGATPAKAGDAKAAAPAKPAAKDAKK